VGVFFRRVMSSCRRVGHQVEQSYTQSRGETSHRYHLWRVATSVLAGLALWAIPYSTYNEVAPFVYPHITYWIVAIALAWAGTGLLLKFRPMKISAPDGPHASDPPRLVSGLAFIQHVVFCFLLLECIWIARSYHPPAQSPAVPLQTVAGRICYVGTSPTAPVPSVLVQVVGTSQQGMTNQDGYFQIANVSPARSMLTASYLGENHRLHINPNGDGDYPVIPRSSPLSPNVPVSFSPSDWHEQADERSKATSEAGTPHGLKGIGDAHKTEPPMTKWFYLEKKLVTPAGFRALHVEIRCKNAVKILEADDLMPDGCLTIVDAHENAHLPDDSATRQWEYDVAPDRPVGRLIFSVWLHFGATPGAPFPTRSDVQGQYWFEVPTHEQQPNDQP
jgi:hypothetical protein